MKSRDDHPLWKKLDFVSLFQYFQKSVSEKVGDYVSLMPTD
jgi:hypothetical protein